MDLASKKKLGTISKVNFVDYQMPSVWICLTGLEEHDLNIISDVGLRNEIIYIPVVGVAWGKGTKRNKSFITLLEVSKVVREVFRGQFCPKVRSKPRLQLIRKIGPYKKKHLKGLEIVR